MDIDAAMLRQCTRVNSQARGDMLVRATDVEITDRVQGQGCSRKQFALDVKTVAMVDGNSNWGERWDADTNKYVNPGMLDAEQKNIESMKLNTLTLDIVLWRLSVLHLALWDHLQLDIFGL